MFRRFSHACHHVVGPQLWLAFLIGLVACHGNQAARAAEEELLALSNANWEGDASVIGGLDAGEPGDAQTLVASADSALGNRPEIELPVELKSDFIGAGEVVVEIGFRANGMQTTAGRVYWDGKLLATINGWESEQGLKSERLRVSTADFDFSAGTHKLKIAAENTDNEWDFFQVDAIRVARPDARRIAGKLIKYEILPLVEGDWAGDGNMWGGLDRAAPLDPDRRAATAQTHAGEKSARREIKVRLAGDYSSTDTLISIGVRRSERMAAKARLTWDGEELLTLEPWLAADQYAGRDSLLQTYELRLAGGHAKLKPGEHVLALEILDPGANSVSYFQVDAMMIEQMPSIKPRRRIRLNNAVIRVARPLAAVEQEALKQLLNETRRLAGVELTTTTQATRRAVIELGKPAGIDARAAALVDYQRRECYLIDVTGQGSESTIHAGGLEPMGTVYALADLQTRLRQDGEGLYFDFPEWAESAEPLFEAPVAETRGEYMNIGYYFPDITPQTWSDERWRSYIDQLVLARLNRVYFYIWVDTYTMAQDSTLAKKPINRRVHEGVREMIDYAHRRGLKVTYMVCPSYAPRDIWDAHPEIHADIVYVEHGFPAVCLRAPGAMDIMKRVWRSEMEWFRAADAIQIWFYDPGGCWCEKHGCKEHQAEYLASDFKTFAAMFRELNPEAALEFNYWPIWLWEEMQKKKYRTELDERIKADFPNEYGRITAVGAPDTDVTLPIEERGHGFDTSIFLFGSNPESAYWFLIPNFNFHHETLNRVLGPKKFRHVFGHRLEAWTRMAATHTMGDWMWKPEQSIEQVALRWANWRAGSPEAGLELAEALMLLEQFTYLGADPTIGDRADFVMSRAFDKLPAARQQDLEYFPAMFKALAVIGHSMETEDNAALRAFADQFGAALAESPTFAPYAAQKERFFNAYREMLKKGWKASPF